MKSGQELFNENFARLQAAAAMQKTDRTPVYLHAGAFAVRYAGGKLADLVSDIDYGQELALQGILKLGEGVDSADLVEYPPISGAIFLSHSKVPGRELPDDMQWQVDERGLMTEEDYDVIINKGWNYFFTDFLTRHITDALPEMKRYGESCQKAEQKYRDAGIVPFSTAAIASPPFGAIGGGRSIGKFMCDLHKIPDKVQEAMDVAMIDRTANLQQQIRAAKATHQILAASVTGGRGAGDFLSMKAFERFVWPYIKRLAEVVVEEGVVCNLHLDMSWDRFLKYFLELPKGKCIFAPDSTTNIFKAYEVLGGHMCFMGDVSPGLLTLGTPDEVYSYSMRLVDLMAPSGFIMGAGCCVPVNAKPENVKAMIAAASGR